MSNEFYLEDAIDVIEEVLASCGVFRMNPKGISMLPLIVQGRDSVVLRRDENRAYKRNDMLFYRRDNGQFVLHRLMKIEDDGTYTMCGDNQVCLESGIRKDQIIAHVEELYRKGKRVNYNGLRYRSYLLVWCCMPIRKFTRLPKRCISKIKRIFSKKRKSG